jgi:hypothetical protein
VFGSVARGDGGTDSDLDIFLVRPTGIGEDDPVWRDQVIALEQAASAWTGNDARSLEYSQSELPRLQREEPVIAEIAADGIVLAGNLRDLRPTATKSR